MAESFNDKENLYGGRIEKFDPQQDYFFKPEFYLGLLPDYNDNFESGEIRERTEVIKDFVKLAAELRFLRMSQKTQAQLEDKLRQLNELYALTASFLKAEDKTIVNDFIKFFGALHDYIKNKFRLEQPSAQADLYRSDAAQTPVEPLAELLEGDVDSARIFTAAEKKLFERGFNEAVLNFRKWRAAEFIAFLKESKKSEALAIFGGHDQRARAVIADEIIGPTFFKVLCDFWPESGDLALEALAAGFSKATLNSMLTKVCYAEWFKREREGETK